MNLKRYNEFMMIHESLIYQGDLLPSQLSGNATLFSYPPRKIDNCLNRRIR